MGSGDSSGGVVFDAEAIARLKLAAEEVAWLTGRGYDDVAKRPLAIDAIDTVAAVEGALAGRYVLQTLDGTVRAFGIDCARYVPTAQADVAIERLLAAAKELRPSLIKVYIDEAATGASDLSSRFTAAAKAQKAKIEIALVPDVPKALRKERQIVTGRRRHARRMCGLAQPGRPRRRGRPRRKDRPPPVEGRLKRQRDAEKARRGSASIAGWTLVVPGRIRSGFSPVGVLPAMLRPSFLARLSRPASDIPSSTARRTRCPMRSETMERGRTCALRD